MRVVAHEDGDFKSKNTKDDISSEVVNQEQDQATAPQELGFEQQNCKVIFINMNPLSYFLT